MILTPRGLEINEKYGKKERKKSFIDRLTLQSIPINTPLRGHKIKHHPFIPPPSPASLFTG